MSRSTDEIQKEIEEEFEMLGDDWQEKYEHIINLGKEMQTMPEALHTEENKVKGCQSNVWLKEEMWEGRLYFSGDSDALIVKGLVALVLRVYSGQVPDEIIKTDPYFIQQTGLSNHLSPTRNNGMAAMLKQVKFYALAYQSKTNFAAE